MVELDQFVEMNLFSLDCGNLRIGSGGYGYARALPGPDFDLGVVKPHNMWGCSNAQIFAEVSLEMHWDFAIKHDLRWLSRWGLVYYGCCEQLDAKIPILRRIPNLRKISESPWCKTERFIQSVGEDYVISRKPNPAVLAADAWDRERAEEDLRDFLRKTEGNCHVELIMKDISTRSLRPATIGGMGGCRDGSGGGVRQEVTQVDTERRGWNIALTATPSHPRFSPILLKGDIAGAFQKAAELGCQGVELHLQRPEDVDPVAVTQLMAQYNLEVPTIGTGMAATEEGLTFSDSDPTVRGRAVARVCAHARLASKIGSAVTIGLMNGRIGACQGDERRIRHRQALDCLAEVCQAARRGGVLILLEPLNRYECDYINTLADGLAVAGEVAADNLRLLADTFHMNIEETDVLASLKAAGALIGYVHLADTNRQAPGHGHLEVAGVLRGLSEIGYQGYLSFEVFPLPDAHTAIRDGIAAVRSVPARTPSEGNAPHKAGKV